MSAVMTENIEIGEILLEAGADPLLVDENGMSAIDHAREIGNEDYIRLISAYIEK
jgi:ankyrin repeat protein